MFSTFFGYSKIYIWMGCYSAKNEREWYTYRRKCLENLVQVSSLWLMIVQTLHNGRHQMEWSGSQPNFLSFLLKLTSLPVQTSYLDQLICIHGNPQNGNGIEETKYPSIYFPGNIQKYVSSQVNDVTKKKFLAKYHWQKHCYKYIRFVICPFEFDRSIVIVGFLAKGILSCAIILFLNTTLFFFFL